MFDINRERIITMWFFSHGKDGVLEMIQEKKNYNWLLTDIYIVIIQKINVWGKKWYIIKS